MYHMKELLRVIAHTLLNPDLGLKLIPHELIDLHWVLRGLSDADFSTDKDNRKSITGFILYLLGCPISRKSKGQGAVSLSSTESEYYAMSEIVQEVKFIVQILEFMNIPVKYPITISVDNVGALYLSRSASSNNRTKHIDTRVHFIRDYQEDGKVLFQFVRSEENDADIFTKNVSSELYQKHSKKLVWTKCELDD